MAIEEFRHLVCRRQGFLLGAALIDRLGAQRPNALNDPGKAPALAVTSSSRLRWSNRTRTALGSQFPAMPRSIATATRSSGAGSPPIPTAARRCMVSIWIDANRE